MTPTRKTKIKMSKFWKRKKDWNLMFWYWCRQKRTLSFFFSLCGGRKYVITDLDAIEVLRKNIGDSCLLYAVYVVMFASLFVGSSVLRFLNNNLKQTFKERRKLRLCIVWFNVFFFFVCTKKSWTLKKASALISLHSLAFISHFIIKCVVS